MGGIFSCLLILALVGWVGYAYFNPNTSSGRFLIKVSVQNTHDVNLVLVAPANYHIVHLVQVKERIVKPRKQVESETSEG